MPQHAPITPQSQPAATAPAAMQPVPELQETELLYPEQLPLQCKLSVGSPDDPLETEADRMADTVMRMPEAPFVQRKCAHCEAEEKAQRKPLAPFIQRMAGNTGDTASPTATAQIRATQGSGNLMPAPARSFMEERFGTDFSQVRIHTGDYAVQLSRELNAQAFTVGNDIYFNAGKYSPSTAEGKHLLAHELTHTIQQGGAVERKVQRRFRPDELMPATGAGPSNPITTAPDSHFFRGSAANTANRRALVIGGIHRGERSAGHLSQEALDELNARTFSPDFHTLFIRANPIPADAGYNRTPSTGRHVDDLNREFGTGYTSPNVIATTITEAVNDFNPERILSVHAISSRSRGGIFLDPIHSRTVSGTGTGVADDIHSYPSVSDAAARERAFAGDSRNQAAMALTESMITATIGSGTTARTPGNVPSTDFPASRYPPGTGSTAAGSSAYSLIYPDQGDATRVVAGRGTSLGTWASGYGRTVVTIEVPGYEARASVYRPYLQGIHRFLSMPPATTGATGTTAPPSPDSQAPRPDTIRRKTEPHGPSTTPDLEPVPETAEDESISVESIIDQIIRLIEEFIRLLETASRTPEPRDRETPPAQLPAGCRTFSTLADLDTRKAHWASIIAGMPLADTIGWIIGMTAPPRAATRESRSQVDCMMSALQTAAAASGSGITLPGSTPLIQSPRRDFAAQQRIWDAKFNFTRRTPFDRISDHARSVCGALLPIVETRWDTANPRHRVAWGVDPASTATPMPPGARALTADERQQEILQASSAPGISRHHWGTDFDIIDPDMNPQEWEGSGSFTDEYSWLQRNASSYGFLQSFTMVSAFMRRGYIEERWHWSYYPVSQALLDFASTHQADIETALHTQWGTDPRFSFIRRHWRDYMFNVSSTPVF